MELFSASGKSFSKNSELKLFMRFWKFSSDFKVEFQASNVEECKEIQNQFENGSLKADEFLAVVDISFKTVDSQMENSGFDIIKDFPGLNIPCIAYSSHDSGGFVEHATSPAVGAKGFVSKTAMVYSFNNIINLLYKIFSFRVIISM